MAHSVALVGGTGYTGVELLRLLAEHPQVQIKTVTSRGEAGQLVSSYFPSLRGLVDIPFVKPDLAQLIEHDIVFFATPHGICMEMAPELLKHNVKVIDLGADFRIDNVPLWEQYYGMPHSCPELIQEAVYGLPEIHREKVKQAQLIANPGCYPTATLLGLMPLIKSKMVDLQQIIVDAKSGVSGAGRAAKMPNLYAEVAEDFRAYGLPAHRHSPEIAEQLSFLADTEVDLSFVPHLLPMIRGILATIYVNALDSHQDMQALYESTYAQEAFVDVLPTGQMPNTASVRGSNKCRISVHPRDYNQQLIIISVIDNLVKGAAGQAVQNMNLMLGLPEAEGLQAVSVYP